MDANEVLVRVFRGHWRLLLACLIVPLLVVGAFVLRTPRSYESSARIQGGTVLPGTDTEADALLNLVDGVATSPATVEGALRAEHLRRDRTATAANITVTRLGSSTVFDVTVADSQPHAAVLLAQAVSGRIVTYLNGVGNARTATLLGNLTQQQEELAALRQKTAAQLALTTDAVSKANLSAQLAGMDQELNDLAATVRQVQLGATPGSSSGAASVISPATSAQPAPGHLASDAGLAVVAGLVLGLLAVTAVEMLRPRVAGARALARDLDAPVVGTLEMDLVRRPRGERRRVRHGAEEFVVRFETDLVVAVSAAAERSRVELLLLAGPVPAAYLGEAAAVLEDELRSSDERAALNGRAVADRPVNGRSTGVPSVSVGSGGAQGGVAAEPVIVLAERPQLPPPADIVERRPRQIDVRPLERNAYAYGGATPGLLVLVPPLAPLRDVRRVGDLAASTGWPVLGVVELRGRISRRVRRAGGRS